MYWLPIAFLTAASLSTADALSKRALKGSDDLVIAWVREGYAVPFLALALLFIDIPRLDATFWLTVLALIPLEVTALILYMRAIRLSPLSLTVPFMALSPVFIIFIAFFVLGELPGPYGMVGIALITSGAYLLNASASRFGILGPLRAIRNEPGSILMIMVAVIYGITSTLGKVAIQHSDPVFFGFFYPLVLVSVMTVVVWRKGRLREVVGRPLTFIPIGLCTAVMVSSHFIALSMTQVAYLISIKRTSLIFSVLYGHFLFSELNIRERLAGSLVMAIGVALIAFS